MGDNPSYFKEKIYCPETHKEFFVSKKGEVLKVEMCPDFPVEYYDLDNTIGASKYFDRRKVCLTNSQRAQNFATGFAKGIGGISLCTLGAASGVICGVVGAIPTVLAKDLPVVGVGQRWPSLPRGDVGPSMWDRMSPLS